MIFTDVWLEPKRLSNMSAGGAWAMTWDVPGILADIVGGGVGVFRGIQMHVSVLLEDGSNVAMVQSQVVYGYTPDGYLGDPIEETNSAILSGDPDPLLETLTFTEKLRVYGVAGPDVTSLRALVSPHVIAAYCLDE